MKQGWRAVGCIVFLTWAFGCAGVPRMPVEPEFPALTALQRNYALKGTTPETWAELAAQFEDYAAKHPASAFKDDALFASAICRVYADRPADRRTAVETFEAFLKTHSESPLAANAVYWCAKTYEKQGNAVRARELYQSLVNRYPESSYAASAWTALAPPVSPKVETVYVRVPVNEEKKSEPASQKATVATPTNSRLDSTSTWQASRVPANPGLAQQMGVGVRTVIIDAGHGGHDGGAFRPGLPVEKDVVLDIAKRLGQSLEKAGFQVRMTRSDDTFIPLLERNRLARSWNCDIFVSVHANSGDSSATGIETYICAPASDAASARRAAIENAGAGTFSELADMLADIYTNMKIEESRSLARQIQNELVSATGAPNRGVKEAPFAVLKGLRVPSVLVETGFVTSPVEGAKLATADYRQTVADAISRAVRQYATPFAYAP